MLDAVAGYNCLPYTSVIVHVHLGWLPILSSRNRQPSIGYGPQPCPFWGKKDRHAPRDFPSLHKGSSLICSFVKDTRVRFSVWEHAGAKHALKFIRSRSGWSTSCKTPTSNLRAPRSPTLSVVRLDFDVPMHTVQRKPTLHCRQPYHSRVLACLREAAKPVKPCEPGAAVSSEVLQDCQLWLELQRTGALVSAKRAGLSPAETCR